MQDESGESGWTRKRASVWARRGVLVVFVGAGLLLWRAMEPLEIVLAFDVDPTFASDDSGALSREDLRRVHGRLLDMDGDERARLSVELPDGLTGPVTPAVALRLPRGHYIADMHLVATEGRQARRAVRLEVEEAGFRRLNLGR